MASRTWIGTASLTILAACSLAPPYSAPPPVPTAAAYKELGPWRPAMVAVPLAGAWWEAFGDAILSDLENRIERANPDLAAAGARYDAARAAIGEARAARCPQLDLAASIARTRVSADRPLALNGAATYNDVVIGPSLAYELDLFGRVRNSVRASEADAQASAGDLAATRLALQANLADSYYQMRGLDARITLLRQTVQAFQRAFELTDTRHTGGIASGIDVSRAAAQLGSARAELEAVAGDRAAFEHAIAALVGESPATLALPVAGALPSPPEVPVGIPSELLQRRPDVAAAERRIAAANARIGVARAALYPSLTLGASAGVESVAGDVFNASNFFWALGPVQAALSIFDGGARRARVRISRAQYEEAAANYRATVLAAFREVEDDLARARAAAAQEREQQAATRAAEKTRDLALIRYRDGASDYLEVTVAQAAALDAERALLAIGTRRLQLAVDTARAVGGTGAAPSAP